MNKDVTIPDAGVPIWGWFWELSRVRQGQQQPIGYSEIASWSQLTGNQISTRECSIIIAMDSAFRAALQEEIASNRARAELRQKQGSK